MTQTDGAGAAPAPAMTLAEAAALYRPALDFPPPGIRFWSGHEMTAHPRAFRCMLDAMETRCRAWSARTQRPIDHVAGFDARGFILGAPVADRLGAGFLQPRKPRKLPPPVHAVSYETEYGTDTLELSPMDLTGRKEAVETAIQGGRSLWDAAKARLFRNKAAVASMWILGIMVLIALFGPMVWVHKYNTISTNVELAPTFENLHLLGTDQQGRDSLARLMIGLRISLAVGMVATIVSLIIGVTWGAVAGFVGGRVDNIMMRFVDVLYAMPFIFFVILLLTVFGRNIILIFAAIGAVEWLTMSRIVRGQTLAIKNMEFIEAARATGVPFFTIIRRHILPNVVGPVAVYVTLTIPVVILAESFLSFLGLGVNEPLTSLGVLISDGAKEMQDKPWMLLAPALTMMVTLLCLNFIGDGLRDALDPKDR